MYTLQVHVRRNMHLALVSIYHAWEAGSLGGMDGARNRARGISHHAGHLENITLPRYALVLSYLMGSTMQADEFDCHQTWYTAVYEIARTAVRRACLTKKSAASYQEL